MRDAVGVGVRDGWVECVMREPLRFEKLVW